MKALTYFTATFTALLVGGLTYLVLLLFTTEFNPLLWPLLPKIILAFDCVAVFYKVMLDDEDVSCGMPDFENPPPPPHFPIIHPPKFPEDRIEKGEI